MDTARKRILYFIEKQHIRPVDFLKKTGLKKGIIDRSHENSGVTDNFLANILDAYNELSARWLVTGKGEMLRSNTYSKNENVNVASEHQENYNEIEMLRDLIVFQKKRILELETRLEKKQTKAS